jgi:hypothetical protein
MCFYTLLSLACLLVRRSSQTQDVGTAQGIGGIMYVRDASGVGKETVGAVMYDVGP